MQTQYRTLGYSVDLHFHNYKLAIEIDENWHNDRNIVYQIIRQKAIGQDLGWEFIRIEPDKEDIDIFEVINKIFRHIKQLPNQLTKQWAKKALVAEISMTFKN